MNQILAPQKTKRNQIIRMQITHVCVVWVQRAHLLLYHALDHNDQRHTRRWISVRPRERERERNDEKKTKQLFFGLSFFIVCRFDRVAVFLRRLLYVCVLHSHFVSKNQKLNARVFFCVQAIFSLFLSFPVFSALALLHSPIFNDLPVFKWTIDENVLHIIKSKVCVRALSIR